MNWEPLCTIFSHLLLLHFVPHFAFREMHSIHRDCGLANWYLWQKEISLLNNERWARRVKNDEWQTVKQEEEAPPHALCPFLFSIRTTYCGCRRFSYYLWINHEFQYTKSTIIVFTFTAVHLFYRQSYQFWVSSHYRLHTPLTILYVDVRLQFDIAQNILRKSKYR